ncbi:MAG TPA: PAS domain S-box protein, partial [Thermoanaerobaculia bacterium]
MIPPPYRLLLVAAPDSRARALVEAGAAGESGMTLETALPEADSAWSATAADAVWIDARSPQALSTAQAIRQLHPEVPFVFVVPGDRRAVMQQMLMLTPLLADAVVVCEEELPERFADVVARLRRDATLRGTFDALNRRIAERSDDETRRRVPGSDRYLASLLAHAPDAIFSTDLEGRVESWNQAAVATFGHGPADIAGEEAAGLAAPDEREDVAELMRRAAAGEAVHRHHLRCLHRDGHLFDAEWTLTLVRDGFGEPRAVVVIARDVSERRRLEEAQAFLIQVSRTLAESLDYATTLGNVARLSLPVLADWCVIDMEGAGGALERVASAHRQPELAPAAEELRGGFPPHAGSRQPGARAIRTAETVFLPDIHQHLAEHTDG